MAMQRSEHSSYHLPRDVLNPDDPRVGSGRDNNTGGTVSHLTASGNDSSSLAALGITFVPVLIYAAICLVIFLSLRSKFTRVYSPKTLSALRLSDDVSPKLPGGWFNWIKPFYQIPDALVLHHSSLDGFLFLRYVKLLGIISAAGCLCAWPILLPIHGTGSKGLVELNLLTIGNVGNSYAFLAHVAVAYIFFGFVLFTVCRECVYWISLRQAYLLSPLHSQRLSSRTVLFTCVPDTYLYHDRIRRLFGPAVQNTWFPTDTRELQRLVKERYQTAVRLEKAEIALIKLANTARTKVISQHMQTLQSPRTDVSASTRGWLRNRKQTTRHRRKDDSELRAVQRADSAPASPIWKQNAQALEVIEDDIYKHPYGLRSTLPDVRGSVAAQWIPAESRPAHRPLANYGRRVDTIAWTRLRIKKLNTQIGQLRRRQRRGDGIALNSIFVAFDSQASAQTAFQIVAHHLPLHMAPRFIGVKPDDVVWTSLRMKWWHQIICRFLIMGFIALAIVFWSIPSALVGAASNVEFLSTHVPFLTWVADLPTAVTGLLQGLLPALALSALMAAVPVMLRACARAAGTPTVPQVEVFTQNAYFIFQVVQVFLVTTLSSAASAALSGIIENPLSAKDLLSENLPKASNFYLSYILVQCLGRSAWGLAHIPELIRHQLIAKSIQNPRAQFKTWHKLRRVHWGSIFPVFTNMGVIAMSYACIAPLILAFSAIGMTCTYYAYRYNLVYSFDSEPDTEGLLYPRALTQLIVGLYMAQVCLIGLFALHTALPAVVLMLTFLIFTIVVHISLNDAVGPLSYNLPRTLALGDELISEEEELEGKMFEESGPCDSDIEEEGEEGEEDVVVHTDTDATRGMEGASSLSAMIRQFGSSFLKSKAKQEAQDSGLSHFADRFRLWVTPDKSRPPNIFTRWLHPDIFDDFQALQKRIASSNMAPQAEFPPRYMRDAYWAPEMWTPITKLWIPQDEAKVSRQEVAHTRELIPIYDGGAWIDDKGRVQVDLDLAPFDRPRMAYRAS